MKTILLVDDDIHLRRLVSATLEGNPEWRVLQAADGMDALDLARRERPDAVLLDVAMPRLDGFAVCRQLKSDPATRNTYVIMLTAAAQVQDRRKGEEAGADGYFTKPFSPLALLSKLDEVLSA